ncbi:ABC transporter substrate-binding protein [Butyrivibrio sp. AC2005]|uniref:ABC transporter substrate-binding protein n=1 Tax=Butyrivibrio sp. AC2005 TaxID=1280672 RepID=UPI00041DBFC2|nr:ABC transporter substrate-binding protein [Butyrivibrio sp. AC2005]
MINLKNAKKSMYLLTAIVLLSTSLSGCMDSSNQSTKSDPIPNEEPDVSRFIVAVEEEPDTVDFQCTSIHYTVAQNVFDRLVEMVNNSHGSAVVLPSLAKSWEVSDDGMTYTFHLREGVTFSNGSPLTASDVLYTFSRLLTHPDSCNQDIVDIIAGADKLQSGETDQLEGFKILGDLDFSITLSEPFAAFLPCLSMPGASIMDEETTTEAGDRFGADPEWTIGTGSFILWKWSKGEGMLLKANKNCWNGAPKCEGLDLRFLLDEKEMEALFEKGELDVLDLDKIGDDADKYLNDDSYKSRLLRAHPVGITYIVLNESVEPLNDVSVRKALQLALDREELMDISLKGRAILEQGIFPHGLNGYNEDLPEISYDPDSAEKLLAEAGYKDGFEMTISVKNTAYPWEKAMMQDVAAMWSKIGVKATVEIIDEAEWMKLRKSGKLACYEATWIADYNDPDNFIYTFFGSKENTTFRSLCYPREDIMKRVRDARGIINKDERIKEYRDLEQTIIQDDAAWIPLFSRLRYYVQGERANGLKASWNGSIKNNYRNMSIK